MEALTERLAWRKMAKFRKRPVIIEAEQFFSVDWEPHEPRQYPSGVYRQGDAYFIKTLEGIMRVSEGDWIITGIQGEKYPCKPDIFAATYDLVAD